MVATMSAPAITSEDLNREEYSRFLVVLDDAPPLVAEILVCLTLYNEPAASLRATLVGLARNQADLYYRFGEGAPRMVVSILLDGRDRVASSTKLLLLSLGLDLDRGLSETDNGFCNKLVLQTQERSVSFFLRMLEGQTSAENSHGRMRIILGTKEKNAGKLDSHAWFFRSIGKMLKPEFAIQIDTGSIPADDCVATLLDQMRRESKCAAIAADVRTSAPPLHQVALTWQYGDFLWEKVTDWPVGHLLGYLEVVSGQGSIIRWTAFCSQPDHEAAQTPVDRYLRGLKPRDSLLERNLFLAEDRIVGFELVVEKGSTATVRHARGAGLVTDPCASFGELLQQRRRWINSTIAAQLRAVQAIPSVAYDETRSAVRRAVIVLTLLWGFARFLLQLLTPTTLAVQFAIGASAIAALLEHDTPSQCGLAAAFVFLLVWIALLALSRQAKPTTHLSSMLHESMAIFLAALVLLNTIPFALGLSLVYFLIISTGACLAGAAVMSRSKDGARDLIRIMVIYGLLTPAVNLHLISYAVANFSDTSWGTKGLTSSSLGRPTMRRWMRMRDAILLCWIGLTSILTFAVVAAPSNQWVHFYFATTGLFLLRIAFGSILCVGQTMRFWNGMGKKANVDFFSSR